MNIICITDSAIDGIQHYQLTDPVWTFEKLREEFSKTKSKFSLGWQGSFRKFIMERGAVLIEIETLDLPSWTD